MTDWKFLTEYFILIVKFLEILALLGIIVFTWKLIKNAF